MEFDCEPTQWKVYRNEPHIHENLDKLEEFLRLKAEPVALWNEKQARDKYSKTPRSKESGLMAAWNVLMALGVNPKMSMREAELLSLYSEKDDASPLPQYLMSCSKYGMTHEGILKAVETLSNARVSGRFFEFYPQRRVDIRYWLAGWMRRGIVPLATLNYQKTVRGVSDEERAHLPPDWHHHMVYGVNYEGINITNPISTMKADHFKTRLESESVILVPRGEILGRLKDGLDFKLIKKTPEWQQMNVSGQIEVISREEERFKELRIPPGMKYIAIPSCMIGGISLFALKDTENYRAIMKSEEVFLKL